jgi:hypothetical protein
MTTIVDRSKTVTRFAMSLWNACGLWPEEFAFGLNRQLTFVRVEDYERLENALRGLVALRDDADKRLIEFNPYDIELVNRCTKAWDDARKALAP